MGNSCLCIGLFVMLAPYPPTCYDFIRDHRLLGIHSDMLHNHRLLTFTSMTVESVNQYRKTACCLVCQLEKFGSHNETLLRMPCPAPQTERAFMRRHHLVREHSLYWIVGINLAQPSEGCIRGLVNSLGP